MMEHSDLTSSADALDRLRFRLVVAGGSVILLSCRHNMFVDPNLQLCSASEALCFRWEDEHALIPKDQSVEFFDTLKVLKQSVVQQVIDEELVDSEMEKIGENEC